MAAGDAGSRRRTRDSSCEAIMTDPANRRARK
jgi:hypothetical protein